MGSLVVEGIGTLVTNAEGVGTGLLGQIERAAMVVTDGTVTWVGPQAQAPRATDGRLDVGGRAVVPGFVDSHAHLVFAGDRAEEFAARMAGTPYTSGGIATTVDATRRATDRALGANVARLVAEGLRSGTTTMECKSGYGLNVADEARSLEVAAAHVADTTFLGAHVVPREYERRRDEYVDLVRGPMLSACAPRSRWIDVFCDRGAFDGDEARAVLTAGRSAGLGLRVHANQLEPGPGVLLAVELGAASADHLNHLRAADVDALVSSGTVATILPGADFCTRAPSPDGRALLDAGATVALATDCNPGTSYTTSMPFCIALAVRDAHLSPDEALWAATMGGARALRRHDVGHLGVGAAADFVVLGAPSPVHLSYRPGVALVDEVWKGGRRVHPPEVGAAA